MLIQTTVFRAFDSTARSCIQRAPANPAAIASTTVRMIQKTDSPRGVFLVIFE